MVEWLQIVKQAIFMTPVLSALLGAVAIRSVEILSAYRSGVVAVHHEIVENYWRIDGEINDIQEGRWNDEYTREVRLDAIKATKSRSPEVYVRLVEDVDQFPVALTSLENIKREQVESRRANAFIDDTEEEVAERLRDVQDILLEVEENLVDYTSETLTRKVLLLNTIERNESFKQELTE